MAKKGPVSPNYLPLQNELLSRDFYEAYYTFDTHPDDRYKRRSWYENLQLNSSIGVYVHQRKNFLGNLTCVWRIRENNERSQEDLIETLNFIKKTTPKYSTRAMRKEFFDRYSKFGIEPAVLRDIYRFTTDDESAGSSQKEEEVDNRLVNFLLESNDTDLLWDLRKLNGRPKNPAFDPFWQEIQKYKDAFAAVDERRHSDILYLPLATSTENLCQIVLDRLPEGSAMPSNSWLHMNFWPSNQYHNNASYHNGRFNLKFKLQQRLVRAQHLDAYYCATLFKFQRIMAVKYREYASIFFVDNKAIVPVGEPERPVSTNV